MYDFEEYEKIFNEASMSKGQFFYKHTIEDLFTTTFNDNKLMKFLNTCNAMIQNAGNYGNEVDFLINNLIGYNIGVIAYNVELFIICWAVFTEIARIISNDEIILIQLDIESQVKHFIEFVKDNKKSYNEITKLMIVTLCKIYSKDKLYEMVEVNPLQLNDYINNVIKAPVIIFPFRNNADVNDDDDDDDDDDNDMTGDINTIFKIYDDDDDDDDDDYNDYNDGEYNDDDDDDYNDDGYENDLVM